MTVNDFQNLNADQLRALLHEQAAEVVQLRSELADQGVRVSRRDVFKGLGLGGLVALGAAGASLTGSAPPVSAAPSFTEAPADLAGEMPALLQLTFDKIPVPGDRANGAIELVYYQSDVKVPRDAASGQATGRRQYAPIIIRKRIDKASPLLAKALANNQTGEGTIRFFRQAGRSGPDQFFTISFTGMRMVSIAQIMPDTNRSSGDVTTPPIEELSFTFQKITWTYVDGGISAADDWEAPVA